MRSATFLPDDWFPIPIPDNAEIGDQSYIYSAYAFAHCRSTRPRAVRIGRCTGVYQHTQFILGPDGEVDIGDYATINATIFSTNSRVVVGDYAMFAYGVVVADDNVAVPGREADPVGPIVVGQNSWIGARCVLVPGAEVGEDSVIGAGTVIDFAVPPGVVVAGNPARVIGQVRG